MFKRIVQLTAVLLIAAVAVSPSAFAAGTEALTVSIEAGRGSRVLWVQAAVSGSATETVSIDIFAPRANRKGKFLWQSCDLAFSGAGEYRCGIDVSKGSPAAERTRKWVAKLEIDGAAAGRTRFSTSK
jgi:hypothetical protein